MNPSRDRLSLHDELPSNIICSTLQKNVEEGGWVLLQDPGEKGRGLASCVLHVSFSCKLASFAFLTGKKYS